MPSPVITSLSVAAALTCAMVGVPARAQVTVASSVTQPAPLRVTPHVLMFDPVVGPPQVQWLSEPGDGNGAAGDTRLPPSFVFEPIRLSLMGQDVPRGSLDTGCSESSGAGTATAATSGFARNRATAFMLVPRLTLAGFSRAGCLDSAAGGALVYARPIVKDIWVVASAGFLHLPHAGPGGSSVTRSDVRADVVFARPNGRSYAVGVGARGVSFGGTF